MKTTTVIMCGWLALGAGGCLDIALSDEIQGNAGEAGENTGGIGADNEPPPTDADDDEPPVVTAVSCAAGERHLATLCLAVGPAGFTARFATDEPAVIAAIGCLVASGDFATEHRVVCRPGVGGLTVADVNGNEVTVELSAETSSGPAVAITEVLADPLGGEPAAELVEIANLGNAPADLSGYSLTDGSGADLLPDGTVLAAGEVALVVGPGFDPASGPDPAVAPDARLITLDSSLGSGGLNNSTPETISLLDGLGAPVSVYAAALALDAGQSAERIPAEAPDADPLAFAANPDGSSTPGQVIRIAP